MSAPEFSTLAMAGEYYLAKSLGTVDGITATLVTHAQSDFEIEVSSVQFAAWLRDRHHGSTLSDATAILRFRRKRCDWIPIHVLMKQLDQAGAQCLGSRITDSRNSYAYTMCSYLSDIFRTVLKNTSKEEQREMANTNTTALTFKLTQAAGAAYDTTKVELEHAGWRAATQKAVKLAKRPIKAAAKKFLTQEQLALTDAFLDTELGEAATSLGLGLLVEGATALGPTFSNPQTKRLASELRIHGYTSLMTQLLDQFSRPLKDLLAQITLPEVED